MAVAASGAGRRRDVSRCSSEHYIYKKSLVTGHTFRDRRAQDEAAGNATPAGRAVVPTPPGTARTGPLPPLARSLTERPAVASRRTAAMLRGGTSVAVCGTTPRALLLHSSRR
jgi:hypothetical protein